jgi:hypothetical protein
MTLSVRDFLALCAFTASPGDTLGTDDSDTALRTTQFTRTPHSGAKFGLQHDFPSDRMYSSQFSSSRAGSINSQSLQARQSVPDCGLVP